MNWKLIAGASAVIALCGTNETDAAHVLDVQESRAVEQIERYCASSWRTARIPPGEWTECSQQVFVELLERIKRKRLATSIQDGDSVERRELKRAIWRVIKRWVRQVRHVPLTTAGDCEADEGVAEASEETTREQRETVLKIATDLTPRHQKILRWTMDGISVSEIARRLNISSARVSDEKYRAIQKIRRQLATT